MSARNLNHVIKFWSPLKICNFIFTTVRMKFYFKVSDSNFRVNVIAQGSLQFVVLLLWTAKQIINAHITLFSVNTTCQSHVLPFVHKSYWYLIKTRLNCFEINFIILLYGFWVLPYEKITCFDKSIFPIWLEVGGDF